MLIAIITIISFRFFQDLFIYLFLESKRKGGREKNIKVWLLLKRPLLGTWPATQACALTGNQTGDPLVHRLALNPLSCTSQGSFLILYFFCLEAPLGSL